MHAATFNFAKAFFSQAWTATPACRRRWRSLETEMNMLVHRAEVQAGCAVIVLAWEDEGVSDTLTITTMGSRSCSVGAA